MLAVLACVKKWYWLFCFVYFFIVLLMVSTFTMVLPSLLSLGSLCPWGPALYHFDFFFFEASFSSSFPCLCITLWKCPLEPPWLCWVWCTFPFTWNTQAPGTLHCLKYESFMCWKQWMIINSFSTELFWLPFLTARCRKIITNSNFAVKSKLDSVI